mmetsp:Transcript_85891/g.199675  ORF Transcript_85891/g.199675 Transcript_85891/m.199675 type:complete len:245 (-) Transcript_85891:684-1418(-)
MPRPPLQPLCRNLFRRPCGPARCCGACSRGAGREHRQRIGLQLAGGCVHNTANHCRAGLRCPQLHRSLTERPALQLVMYVHALHHSSYVAQCKDPIALGWAGAEHLSPRGQVLGIPPPRRLLLHGDTSLAKLACSAALHWSERDRWDHQHHCLLAVVLVLGASCTSWLHRGSSGHLRLKLFPHAVDGPQDPALLAHRATDVLARFLHGCADAVVPLLAFGASESPHDLRVVGLRDHSSHGWSPP